MSEALPHRAEILDALGRLLAWSEIARSPQLGRFLDYIVRRTLDGEGAGIKAYSIAVDVFGRPTDFDPQTDPIVRVQARRLRGLLDQYYAGEGESEATRINLPVGRYVPDFVCVADSAVDVLPVQAVQPPVSGWPLWQWLGLLVLIGVAGAVLGLALREPRPAPMTAMVQPPSVTIVEFNNLAGDAPTAPMAAGVAIELVTDLEQFGDIVVRYGGGGVGNVGVGEVPVTDYVLTGVVRENAGTARYSAVLTDNSSGLAVWSQTIAIPTEAARQVRQVSMVSRRFSMVLGSPRGPLHQAARQFLASGVAPAGAASPYFCRVLFDFYRQTGALSDADRASACVEALPTEERDAPEVLAMTASLTIERIDLTQTVMEQDNLVRPSAEMLDRAIGLGPLSGFVWEQQARLNQSLGRTERALADFNSALQLNPANADTMAAYARLVAFSGALADARRPAQIALRDAPNPPGWYFAVPALLALQDGDYVRAINLAGRYALVDQELGAVLALLGGQGAKNEEVVARYLPDVMEAPRFRQAGIMPQLRRSISNAALLETIATGLVAAGVPEAALEAGF